MNKMILIVFLAVVVSGCTASTRAPSVTSNLQIKVAQLERQLQQRDEDIANLKDDVAALQKQVSGLSNVPQKAAVPVVQPVAKPVSSEASSGTDEIIRVNASSTDVQQALKNAGYYNGAIDGKIGTKTKEAIMTFQKDHDLKADGVIGQRTWSELQRYL